ncbi:hypothetical protein DPMN_029543 [Dreissena polymorpha]|uniref:Uncharacterized protein n=3 Tax=Dreissena polymorpha TaxID=45954 RepID=A0A9D4LYX0_DREPO|nr:hypothetical protein DPMN_029543 [Dreissena polymorpha]
MKTYNERNISLILETFAQETNSSIVVCSLRETKGREWSLNLLETCTSIISGNVCKHQYGNPIISIHADERFAMCSVKSTLSLEIPLCNAVNREDLGAKHFVGNLSGHFQLEVLYSAGIREFYILGLRERNNIPLTNNTTVTVICEAFGNPSPIVELVTPSNSFTNKSFLQLDIMIIFSRTNVAQLTCIASNGFGNDSKSIYVHEDREGHSGSTTITIVICLGSIVLGLLSMVCIYRGRYKLLEILQRKVAEPAFEMTEDAEGHLTNFPGHNNVNNLENEASHSETSQESIPSNDRVLKTRGFCNETYAECTSRCGQQYYTDDNKTDPHTSSSLRTLSFDYASQDACRSEASTTQAECIYSIAKEIKQ